MINNSAISAVPLHLSDKVVIQIYSVRPDVQQPIDPPDKAGRIAGYFNPSTNRVEIYVVSGGGNFWIKVGG
jgi:hypothetical protein|tara:strand:- start:534 stop:746 length:213 start_codon:yes stop_codon:yes gene_type:complete